jgi:flagellar motor switch protein FliN/FliY
MNRDGNLAALLDVPLKVTVELGRTQMALADILALRSGSVIELDRFEGEPVDVKAGGRLIARGVVVVVNGRLGVRLTEIVDASKKEAG